MKVKRINQLDGIKFTGGVSFRPVLERDNMGFSICKTVVPKGGPHKWHYKNHLEACYCIKGCGFLTDLKNNIQHIITKDVVYILDEHDEHTFEAIEDTVLISVFNPPLIGSESHNNKGVYEKV